MGIYKDKPEPIEPKSSVNKRAKLTALIGGVLLTCVLGYEAYNAAILSYCQSNKTLVSIYLHSKGKDIYKRGNVKNLFIRQGQEVLVQINAMAGDGLVELVLDVNKGRSLTRYFNSKNKFYEIGLGNRFPKGKYNFELKALSKCGNIGVDKAILTVEDNILNTF